MPCIIILAETLTTTQIERDCEECQCNSFHLLITGICPAFTITAVVTAIITAVIMKFYFEVKSRRRNIIKFSSPLNCADTTENAHLNTTGPLYEEVELTDKDISLKFSQNVAYHSIPKKITT